MSKKRKRLFDFVQENGEWKSKPSMQTAFFFSQTYGLPLEMFIDVWEKKMNELTSAQILFLKMEDWQDFAQENNINLEEIRRKNEGDKSN